MNTSTASSRRWRPRDTDQASPGAQWNQRGNLAGLADQSDAAIGRMLESAQHAQAHYQASVDAHKQSLAAFNQHGRPAERTSMSGRWIRHWTPSARR